MDAEAEAEAVSAAHVKAAVAEMVSNILVTVVAAEEEELLKAQEAKAAEEVAATAV